MHRLQRWLNASELPATTVSFYDDRPFVAVIVDPASDARAASLNRNRIYFCGGQESATQQLQQNARLFESHGVSRFFAWLSPGPEIAALRASLTKAGAVKVTWTRYPTLAYAGPPSVRSGPHPEVRDVSPDDIEAARQQLAGASMDAYLRSVGRPGFRHFVALEGGQPIATAALACFEDIAYLTYAQTAEDFRRRGAQSALIAARVRKAQDLGYSLIVSQTLTMLEDSHANLKRAGFEEMYEQEVYECSTAAFAQARL